MRCTYEHSFSLSEDDGLPVLVTVQYEDDGEGELERFRLVEVVTGDKEHGYECLNPEVEQLLREWLVRQVEDYLLAHPTAQADAYSRAEAEAKAAEAEHKFDAMREEQALRGKS